MTLSSIANHVTSIKVLCKGEEETGLDNRQGWTKHSFQHTAEDSQSLETHHSCQSNHQTPNSDWVNV